MDVDILYHLGIDTSDLGAIKAKFGDVKVVAMGGSRGRVITFAKYAYEQLKNYYQTIIICVKLLCVIFLYNPISILIFVILFLIHVF